MINKFVDEMSKGACWFGCGREGCSGGCEYFKKQPVTSKPHKEKKDSKILWTSIFWLCLLCGVFAVDHVIESCKANTAMTLKENK